mmetsp:Transcript_13552/g.44833  ORF Transcript_13552/g.44833 Transcript_13552/m.44833 type:complete len:286 (-) Transcript_13552:146-1003(-)
MVACAVRWLSAAAVASLALLWRRIRPIVRLSVHALQERSHELYAAKRFDEALEAAAAARDLARNELGEESSTHQRMIFHLAAVLAAMRRHEETGALLSECEVLACRMHGDSSLALVPICHARAELHEAAGDYALAIAALERARDLRHDSLGSAHPDYARSCFNLAGLLLCRAFRARGHTTMHVLLNHHMPASKAPCKRGPRHERSAARRARRARRRQRARGGGRFRGCGASKGVCAGIARAHTLRWLAEPSQRASRLQGRHRAARELARRTQLSSSFGPRAVREQ